MLGDLIREAREAKGLKKAGLARKLGISGSAVSQWESGATTPDDGRFLEICRTLSIDISDERVIEITKDIYPWMSPPKVDYVSLVRNSSLEIDRMIDMVHDARKLVEEDQRKSSASNWQKDKHQDIKSSVLVAEGAEEYRYLSGLARDIPIKGIAVAGRDGDFRLNGEDVDRAIRPPGLATAKNIFALYVVNDSMYPAWKEGALFYVNPNRPPSIGDDVVIELKSEVDGVPGPAFLKRLKARTPLQYICEQFNPPQEIAFTREAVACIYRVIPWEEALGLSS